MNSTILIVDDNPKNLQVLGSTLEQENYSVEFAINGKAALGLIEKLDFDLILLDVMMPEMDGFEVCQKVRASKNNKDVPIIFLTAKTDRESIIKGFEIGGQDYVTKPFDSGELLARVKTQVELRQSKQALKSLNTELENRVKERTIELEQTNNALAESEKRYRYALEASNDGIWIWDLEKDEIEFSVTLYSMLGYENNEFPQNRKEINKRTHPDDLEDRDKVDYVSRIRQIDEQYLHDEYRLRTKNGEYKWMRVKGQVLERSKDGEIIRMIGTHTDITSEKQKNQEILEAILKTEDRERSRISKDIHDGLQQTLTVSLLNFEGTRKEIDGLSQDSQKKFDTGWEYLQKGITESRVVAHSLMPKAILDYGLVSACESLIELMNNTIDQTEFRFIHNFENHRMDNQQIEITLYRIIQEAINNIIKHADASCVDIQLKNYEDIILLTIEDNGVGFDVKDVSEKGLGLKSIQNRLEAINAYIEIESRPRKGTNITVQIEKKQIEK